MTYENISYHIQNYLNEKETSVFEFARRIGVSKLGIRYLLKNKSSTISETLIIYVKNQSFSWCYNENKISLHIFY